ncbi:glycosyltransferase family 4 protein [Aquimarina pacifica]|uniref:glycosyltransferase family 4 protein n=1 Tax=Aquimarina pacifica TaxID=1296415 RepID=UPI000472489F|nr:glycosyltransferase family 4 protein [Aquimarina pacifica]
MKHILIIGFVWPEPNSSAAGSRMLQLLTLFRAQQWQVTFASAASESSHMTNLTDIGVNKVSIELNNSSFDTFIKELQPDIVLFDRFMIEEQFGWRVIKHCPDALRILNTEDIHSLRKTRQEQHTAQKKFELKNLLDNDITKREIASIHRSDISLIISDFEMKLLHEFFEIKKEQLFYLPFLLDPITQETKKKWPHYEERENFITIGNFRHAPNWNSILYLKETIWPLIRKQLPKAELHIYGAYPPPKATQLQNTNEGFYIKGWAKDADEVMQKARVCLAPLRFGAGIKGKLTEAMLCGTPSITTSIGAEGMIDPESDWNGFITDTPSSFAKSATQLYTNKFLWQQSQQNGIEIINTRFQKHSFSERFINHLTTTLETIKNHRSNNFIGSILNYHTLRSTEYLSRWIEEKNK